MPLIPNNANIFGDLMRRPDIAANWFQGAVSPNAYGPSVGGGGSFSPNEQSFLMGTEATGQPVESLPREGLFPKLLAHIGLISPDMHPDTQTQFAEQILLKNMKEQEAEKRSNAIDHAYNIVKEIGGDRFAQIGPSLFRGIIDDPGVFESFKGVPSYADAMAEKYQAAFTNQLQLQDVKNDARMQQIELQNTDAMSRLEEQVGARGDIAGASQQDRDLSLLNKVFNGGLLPDKEGFGRALNEYLQSGDVRHAISAGQTQSKAPDDGPGILDDLRTGIHNWMNPPAADPAKKKAALQALGIGS